MTRAINSAPSAAPGRRRRRALALLLVLMVGAVPVHAAFDSRDNRFEYAREYRDPTWPGYYLRGRWYDPRLPAFVGRDPATAQLNHYGYGGADPVQHVDPSGHSYRGFAHDVGAALKDLNGGVGGHFARFFLAPVIGPMQILANPKGFWSGIAHDKAGMDIFLVGGIVAEGAPWLMPFQTGLVRETVRSVTQAALGVGQSAVASTRGGIFHPHGFDGKTMGEGLEYTFGPLATARLGLGVDYQPFNLSADMVENAIEHQLDRDRATSDVLFFRVRTTAPRHGWTTPWMEHTDLGLYHERLLIVSRAALETTEYVGGQVQFDAAYLSGGWVPQTFTQFIHGTPNAEAWRFEYVGRARDFDATPFGLNSALPPSRIPNQCHLHVNRVLQACGIR